MSEGYLRILCPHCGEMRATVNARNNLAHCFCCKKNLNNIDLLLSEDYDFVSAVALLERWLKAYQGQQAQKWRLVYSRCREPAENPLPASARIQRAFLWQQLGSEFGPGPPTRRPASPTFSRIRQTALHHARILTA